MDKVNLIKNKFSREEFEKIININFNELYQFPPTEEESDWDINKFFEEYEKLFYRIPERGEFNSHEYLIKKSNEYINYDEINEAIQSLLEEITDLRLQILELTQENIILRNPNITDSEIDSFEKQKISNQIKLTQSKNEILNKVQEQINPKSIDPLLESEKIRTGGFSKTPKSRTGGISGRNNTTTKKEDEDPYAGIDYHTGV